MELWHLLVWHKSEIAKSSLLEKWGKKLPKDRDWLMTSLAQAVCRIRHLQLSNTNVLHDTSTITILWLYLYLEGRSIYIANLSAKPAHLRLCLQRTLTNNNVSLWKLPLCFFQGMLVTSEMKCYSTFAQLKVKALKVTIVFILLFIMSPFNSS